MWSMSVLRGLWPMYIVGYVPVDWWRTMKRVQLVYATLGFRQTNAYAHISRVYVHGDGSMAL